MLILVLHNVSVFAQDAKIHLHWYILYNVSRFQVVVLWYISFEHCVDAFWNPQNWVYERPPKWLRYEQWFFACPELKIEVYHWILHSRRRLMEGEWLDVLNHFGCFISTLFTQEKRPGWWKVIENLRTKVAPTLFAYSPLVVNNSKLFQLIHHWYNCAVWLR